MTASVASSMYTSMHTCGDTFCKIMHFHRSLFAQDVESIGCLYSGLIYFGKGLHQQAAVTSKQTGRKTCKLCQVCTCNAHMAGFYVVLNTLYTVDPAGCASVTTLTGGDLLRTRARRQAGKLPYLFMLRNNHTACEA